jgi:hypothetical protein
MKRLWTKIKTYISPFLNWRILIIYLPIWFIMSGWTYLFIYLGTKYSVGWMLAAGTFWATVLWLPITPEKLITVPLTLFIYVKWVGHSDPKFEHMLNEARGDWQNTKTWFNKNYGRLVKTFIILLVTMILLGLLLVSG